MMGLTNIKTYVSSILVLYLIISGCKTTDKAQKVALGNKTPGPPTIVYKMKKDYSQNVPVILSADKSNITSYPAVEDVNMNGSYPLPTLLSKGYYLDNRGINPNVAFTLYTYEDYSKLPATPSVDELFIAITNNNPILEMYDCGNRLRYSNIETDLNSIIDRGELAKKCTRLK
jgi:hypothetical protein